MNENRLNICKIENELYDLHLKLAQNNTDFFSIDSKYLNYAENLSRGHSNSLSEKIFLAFFTSQK